MCVSAAGPGRTGEAVSQRKCEACERLRFENKLLADELQKSVRERVRLRTEKDALVERLRALTSGKA